MSGYEKEPDYGGPDPSWKEGIILAVVVVCVTVVLFLIAQ